MKVIWYKFREVVVIMVITIDSLTIVAIILCIGFAVCNILQALIYKDFSFFTN